MREPLIILLFTLGMISIVLLHRPDPRLADAPTVAHLLRGRKNRVFRTLLEEAGRGEETPARSITAR